MKLLFTVVLLFYFFLFAYSLSPPASHSSILSTLKFPFANDGIVNPPSHYQRYRRDEYPQDKPFYQWWYYMLSDFSENRFFFLCFYIDETTVGKDHSFRFCAGEVNTEKGTHWYRYESFNISVLSIENDFDLTARDPETGEIMYQLQVIDNDTFHISGTMNHTKNVVISDNIPADTVIHVDFTVSRLIGWYGQYDIEKITVLEGEVMWNTYAHNSLVEGIVNVGNLSHVYDHSTQFRAYGDMNWGETFPQGNSIPDDLNYPWGWYTAQVPSEDPTMDFSYAVGAGTMIEGDILQTVVGGFGDFHFNNTHLGVRLAEARDTDHLKIPILKTSTDGELHSFTFGRYNYVPYYDPMNKLNYSVPLGQWLEINTTHYGIVLNYTTAINQMNRLPMPLGDVTVSNFESLGATVHVQIDYYDDTGKIENIYDFITHSGGLECGYITGR